MNKSQAFSVPGLGNSFLGKSFQPSISRVNESLDYTLMVFDTKFKINPDEAVASVLIHRFEVIDLYGAMADYVSATSEFEKAWFFLDELLRRPGLKQRQYHAIIRGANRLKSEWSVYLSYGNKRVADEDQILDYLSVFNREGIKKGRVLH